MLDFKKELENDDEYSYEKDYNFYSLKYPKLEHFDISVSICQLFQPISYNDEKDIKLILYVKLFK